MNKLAAAEAGCYSLQSRKAEHPMNAKALFLLAVVVSACGALLPEAGVKSAEAPPASTAPAASGETKVAAGLAAPATLPGLPKPAVTPESALPKISPAVADVVKLVKGGVDAAIVEAYVANSNIAYYPRPDEILYLREAGVPSAVIGAMMKRGKELREQDAQAFKENQERQAQTSAAAAQPAANPNVVVVQPAPSIPVTAPAPIYNNYVSGYPAYTYSYGYPFYYDYGFPIYTYRYYSPFRAGYPSWAHRPFPIGVGPGLIHPPSRPFRGAPGINRPGIPAPPRSPIGRPGRH